MVMYECLVVHVTVFPNTDNQSSFLVLESLRYHQYLLQKTLLCSPPPIILIAIAARTGSRSIPMVPPPSPWGRPLTKRSAYGAMCKVQHLTC